MVKSKTDIKLNKRISRTRDDTCALANATAGYYIQHSIVSDMIKY